MFKRRTRRSYAEIAAGWIYPPGGWHRAVRYIGHRLRRLPDPAHKIARGIAVGVFVSFTPLFGLHFLISAGFAWAIGANVLAALLATFFGNPVTFPIIATIAVEFGSWILGQPRVPLQDIVAAFSLASVEVWANFAAPFTDREITWTQSGRFFERIFWPYMIGGLPIGLVVGIVAYYFSYPLIHAYQRARIVRMKRKISRMREAQERADTAAGAK